MGLFSRLPSEAAWMLGKSAKTLDAHDKAARIVRETTERTREPGLNQNGREALILVDDAGDLIGSTGRGSPHPAIGTHRSVGMSQRQLDEVYRFQPGMTLHHSHPTGGGGIEIDGKEWGQFAALSPPDLMFPVQHGDKVPSIFAHMPEGGWSAANATQQGRSVGLLGNPGTDIDIGLQFAVDEAHTRLPILGDGLSGGEVFSRMNNTATQDPAAMALLGWSGEGNNRALHRMGVIDYDAAHHDPGSMDRFAEVIKAAEEAALRFYRVQWSGLGLKERAQILGMLGVGGAAADALMQDQQGNRGLMSRSDV